MTRAAAPITYSTLGSAVLWLLVLAVLAGAGTLLGVGLYMAYVVVSAS